MGALEAAGYQIVASEEKGTIALLNTCAFIAPAVEESENTIKELITLKEKGLLAMLVVTGCYPQRFTEKMTATYPQVDAWLGIADREKIVEVIEQKQRKITLLEGIHEESFLRRQVTLPHSAYLKIAEGCDNCCSYCTIPFIRGRYRSKKIDDIIEEAVKLVHQGVKEISLIAQDTTSYGLDLYKKPSLVPLLKKLCRLDGLSWIRLLYTYPETINEDLLQLMAQEPKICKYLDIPLQHISDNVLQRMKRRSTADSIKSKINRARELMPEISLRTTFIVGFPGESEDDFAQLIELIDEFEFNKLSVFEYWQEAGTPAAGYSKQILPAVKKTRAIQLIDKQSEVIDRMNKKMIGKELTILMDTPSFGRSQAEAPDIDGGIEVYLQDHSVNKKISPGEFLKVHITSAAGYLLRGHVLT